MDIKQDVEAILLEKGQKKIWLAQKMGVTPQTLNTIFSKDNPTQGTLIRLSNGLGVEVQRLMDLLSQGSPNSDDSDFVYLPLLSPVASAGPGETTEEEQVLNVMKFITK